MFARGYAAAAVAYLAASFLHVEAFTNNGKSVIAHTLSSMIVVSLFLVCYE